MPHLHAMALDAMAMPLHVQVTLFALCCALGLLGLLMMSGGGTSEARRALRDDLAPDALPSHSSLASNEFDFPAHDGVTFDESAKRNSADSATERPKRMRVPSKKQRERESAMASSGSSSDGSISSGAGSASSGISSDGSSASSSSGPRREFGELSMLGSSVDSRSKSVDSSKVRSHQAELSTEQRNERNLEMIEHMKDHFRAQFSGRSEEEYDLNFEPSRTGKSTDLERFRLKKGSAALSEEMTYFKYDNIRKFQAAVTVAFQTRSKKTRSKTQAAQWCQRSGTPRGTSMVPSIKQAKLLTKQAKDGAIDRTKIDQQAKAAAERTEPEWKQKKREKQYAGLRIKDLSKRKALIPMKMHVRCRTKSKCDSKKERADDRYAEEKLPDALTPNELGWLTSRCAGTQSADGLVRDDMVAAQGRELYELSDPALLGLGRPQMIADWSNGEIVLSWNTLCVVIDMLRRGRYPFDAAQSRIAMSNRLVFEADKRAAEQLFDSIKQRELDDSMTRPVRGELTLHLEMQALFDLGGRRGGRFQGGEKLLVKQLINVGAHYRIGVSVVEPGPGNPAIAHFSRALNNDKHAMVRHVWDLRKEGAEEESRKWLNDDMSRKIKVYESKYGEVRCLSGSELQRSGQPAITALPPRDRIPDVLTWNQELQAVFHGCSELPESMPGHGMDNINMIELANRLENTDVYCFTRILLRTLSILIRIVLLLDKGPATVY